MKPGKIPQGLGLLFLVLVLGGLRLQNRAEAAPAPAPAPEKKVQDEKKADKTEKKQEQKPALVPDLKGLIEMQPFFPNGMDPANRRALEQKLEEIRKQVEQALKQAEQQVPGGLPGVFPNGVPGGGGVLFPRPGMAGVARANARLGVRLSPPSETLVQQLDLPKGQGLVLDEVRENTVAAKGGLRTHDILLELNGKVVPNQVDQFTKNLAEVKANTPVDAVVLRKGRRETVKGLNLPEAPKVDPNRPIVPMFPFPNIPNFPNLPGIQGGIGGIGINMQLSTIRNGNQFTTTQVEGNLRIVVKGEVNAGQASVSEIAITENGVRNDYKRIEDVPAAQREKVQKLVDLNTRGRILLEGIQIR